MSPSVRLLRADSYHSRMTRKPPEFYSSGFRVGCFQAAWFYCHVPSIVHQLQAAICCPSAASCKLQSVAHCSLSVCRVSLKSVIGDLSNTYFVENAPMGHMIMPPKENGKELSTLKRFIFKSQVIATDKFDIKKGKDFVWVTKDELLEYFPEQTEYLDLMIISL